MSESETSWVKTSGTEEWISLQELSIPNRAMNFGDGIFETMYFDGHKIRFFDYHLARIKKGLTILGMETREVKQEKIEQLLQGKYPEKKLRVRWNLFRSGTGKYTPLENGIVQTLHLEDFHHPPFSKKETGFCTTVFLSPSGYSSLKTLNGLPYIIAAQERVSQGWDEIILLDIHGNIAEGGVSNLFWKIGQEVFTPSLETGCIAGVGREVILEKLKGSGVVVREGLFSKKDLFQAEMVWVSNALGISYLDKIESTEYSIEPWSLLADIFK